MEEFLLALVGMVGAVVVLSVGAACFAPLVWFGSKFVKALDRMMSDEEDDNKRNKQDKEVNQGGVKRLVHWLDSLHSDSHGDSDNSNDYRRRR